MKTITATAIVSATSACLSAVLFVGALNLASTASVQASPVPMQTVVIQHARMTEAEKQAYDLELEQNAVSQVVVIRGKRLTAEEKAAQ